EEIRHVEHARAVHRDACREVERAWLSPWAAGRADLTQERAARRKLLHAVIGRVGGIHRTVRRNGYAVGHRKGPRRVSDRRTPFANRRGRPVKGEVYVCKRGVCG